VGFSVHALLKNSLSTQTWYNFSSCKMQGFIHTISCKLYKHWNNKASRIDTRKMSFFARTVWDWNLLAPDIVELDTPEAFKARIVSLYTIVQTVTTVYSFNCKFNLVIITYYHLFGNLFKLWLHYSLGMLHKNQNCIIFNMMKEAIIWQKQKPSKSKATLIIQYRTCVYK
jgi:hypothetical protein